MHAIVSAFSMISPLLYICVEGTLSSHPCIERRTEEGYFRGFPPTWLVSESIYCWEGLFTSAVSQGLRLDHHKKAKEMHYPLRVASPWHLSRDLEII